MSPRIALVLPMMVLTCLTGCSSGDGSTAGKEPGAEVTVVEAPDVETGDEPEGPAGGGQVSAELPGLPIGGVVGLEAAGVAVCGTLAFNGTVPDGVAFTISGLDLPGPVSVADAGCSGPLCLDGGALTSERSTCEVGLVWDGEPLGDGTGVITTTGATATCDTQEVCDRVPDLISDLSAAEITVPDPDDGL